MNNKSINQKVHIFCTLLKKITAGRTNIFSKHKNFVGYEEFNHRKSIANH